jgi:hypothetical protein
LPRRRKGKNVFRCVTFRHPHPGKAAKPHFSLAQNPLLGKNLLTFGGDGRDRLE